MTDKARASLTPRLITDYAQQRDFWSKPDALHGNAQSFDWIDCWRRHVNPDSLVAGLFTDDAPVMLLPLEAVSVSGTNMLRYPGGSHANCNFPWLDGAVDHASLDRLVLTIRAARPDIDVLSLTRQLPSLSGRDNPLLTLKSIQNPNPVLAASLINGFEAVLEEAMPSGNSKNIVSMAAVMKRQAGGAFTHRSPMKNPMRYSIRFLR